MAVERGERVIVGVNRFVDPDEEVSPTFAIDPGLEPAQARRTRALKSSRDEPQAKHSLQRLEETARREMNLTPSVIDAAKAGATLGEISDRLRRVYGTHDPNA
jgi:methylmalonyl-CoA mutase N-terminal domain/subunit